MHGRLAGGGSHAAAWAAAARLWGVLLAVVRHPAVRLARAAAARVVTVRLKRTHGTGWGTVRISLLNSLVRSAAHTFFCSPYLHPKTAMAHVSAARVLTGLPAARAPARD